MVETIIQLRKVLHACPEVSGKEEKTKALHFGRNIFFLFQPAEETGAGAQGCLELFRHEAVGEIYGAHNLPRFPLGQVVTRPGTFACASRGVLLYFRGKPTHAAYPENGVSPACAVGKLLCALSSLADPSRYTGMTLCTVIGVKMGEKAFGAAAAAAEVWLTLRKENFLPFLCVGVRILGIICRPAPVHFWESAQVKTTRRCIRNTMNIQMPS